MAAPPVRAVISSNGFTINDAKTRLRHYSQRQVVTGLVTNQILNVPRDYVRSLRFLLHIWKSHGEAAAAAALVRHRPENRAPSRPPADFRLSVRGKVQYLGSVKGWDDPVYTALAAKLHLMDARFFLPERILGGPPTTCFIFAEGKTDHIHLQGALAHFQSAGRFNDLLLRPDDKRTGEQDILRACDEMAKSPHDPPAPTIFVFDRDSPGIIPKVTAPPALFKEWRRNLFSFALPIPPHRAGTDVLCIEMLYPDEVLQRRENGRRIYLRSEFNEGGRHRTEPVFCNNWKSRCLVREDDAMSDTTGEKVCLSKNAFAEAVRNRNPPFEHVSFDGFLPVLETLAAIRTHVLAQSH